MTNTQVYLSNAEDTVIQNTTTDKTGFILSGNSNKWHI